MLGACIGASCLTLHLTIFILGGNLSSIPNSIKEVAKSSLLVSQKPRRHLPSWFSLPEVGWMVYGCLKHSAQNTPGNQEIPYSYWISKLEHCLNCFWDNLLSGCVLEVCSKQNQTRQGPHLHASLKPHCCVPLLLPTQRSCCTQNTTSLHRFFTPFQTAFVWREGIECGKVTPPCWDCKGNDALGCILCPAQGA